MMRFRMTGTVIAGALCGVLVGVGIYTFVYARGSAYLGSDPAACVNCHVMAEQYGAWLKSSHRAVATCNDCHTPHSLLPKYFTKASNGFHHSFAFTTGRFPDNIQIKGRNRTIAEHSCRHCHNAIVQDIDHASGAGALDCTRCHVSVGHPR